jgi:hypothetical protein
VSVALLAAPSTNIISDKELMFRGKVFPGRYNSGEIV